MRNSIDFGEIRSHEGSQDKAFEELCCQLFWVEKPENAKEFFRIKGDGGDAGCECYWLLNDGTIHALQAKYFLNFTVANCDRNNYFGQITKSVNSAIDKQHSLTKYYICIPDNLTDHKKNAIKGKNAPRSTKDLWDENRSEWEQYALSKNRQVEFIRWDKFELTRRLQESDPRYSGRTYFWFNKLTLHSDWFSQKVAKTTGNLNNRYMPEFHVSLPHELLFHALAWDDQFRAEINKYFEELLEGISFFSHSKKEFDYLGNQSLFEELTREFKALAEFFTACIDVAPTTNIYNKLKNQFATVESLCTLALQSSYSNTSPPVQLTSNPSSASLDTHTNSDLEIKQSAIKAKQGVRHWLYTILRPLQELKSFVQSQTFEAGVTRAVLVDGEGGRGKSHLFAKGSETLCFDNTPCIFLLGNYLKPVTPWEGLFSYLSLESVLTSDIFLGALDAAGQSKGVRSVIIIDSLNDTPDASNFREWQHQLGGLIQEVLSYQHLAIAFSCRDVFTSSIAPSSIQQPLVRIHHRGFEGYEREAMAAYFDKRGLDRPNSPILSPEFSNPLFLKICSDSLCNFGLKSLPKGLHGTPHLLGFYLDSLESTFETTSKAYRQSGIKQALLRLAKEMGQGFKESLPKRLVITCLEDELIVSIEKANIVLDGLVSEGVLIEFYDPQTSKREIRFTFQRFSDYSITEALLENHFDSSLPEKSFEEGSPLHHYLKENCWQQPNVIEMLSILIPELSNRELLSLIPEPLKNSIVNRAFLESIKWRQPDKIFQETLSIFDTFAPRRIGEDPRLEVLLMVATDPGHLMNAKFLHTSLQKWSMADRDFLWTIPLTLEYAKEQNHIITLLDWAHRGNLVEVEQSRLELCTVVMTWFLSTSHRALRDRATKAIARAISYIPAISITLLELFKDINDLAIQERLLAAVYGGTILADDKNSLPALSEWIYLNLFVNRKPPVHLLLRDYARGIVEYAICRGVTSEDKININHIRPPYLSSPPERVADEKEMEAIAHRERAKSVFANIYYSDFIHYTLTTPTEWTETPLGENTFYTSKTHFDAYARDVQGCQNAVLQTGFQKIIEFIEEQKKRYSSERKSSGHSRFEDFIQLIRAPKSDETRDKDYQEVQDVISNFATLSPDADYESYRKERDLKDKAFEDFINSYTSQLDEKGKIDFFERGYNYVYEVYHSPWNEGGHIVSYSTSQAAGWIFKRVLELGWKSEKFQHFDKYYAEHSSRKERPIFEQISEKYQYIAYYELLARLADNKAWNGDHKSMPQIYQGPWQIHERDIDPSYVRGRFRLSKKEKNKTNNWWLPFSIQLANSEPSNRSEWLWSNKDFPDIESLLKVKNPQTNQDWIVLEQYADAGERPKDGLANREVWIRIRSAIIKNADHQKIIDHLKKKKDLRSNKVFSTLEADSSIFIGENPWHPLINEIELSGETPPSKSFPFTHFKTHLEYKWSYSLSFSTLDDEKGLSFFLPSAWLIEQLSLTLSESLCFIDDTTGEVVFLDPSIIEGGAPTPLISRKVLGEFLKSKELMLIWVIGGEKNSYQPKFDGRHGFSGVYFWNGYGEVQGDWWKFESERKHSVFNEGDEDMEIGEDI